MLLPLLVLSSVLKTLGVAYVDIDTSHCKFSAQVSLLRNLRTLPYNLRAIFAVSPCTLCGISARRCDIPNSTLPSSSFVLRSPCAMSGTELAYGATSLCTSPRCTGPREATTTSTARVLCPT
eukprot:72805-Rhodomonas_salina.6